MMPRRHPPKNEAALHAERAPMRAHEHSEAGGVDHLQLGEVEDQVSLAGVDRVVQTRPHPRRRARVEPRPDPHHLGLWDCPGRACHLLKSRHTCHAA